MENFKIAISEEDLKASKEIDINELIKSAIITDDTEVADPTQLIGVGAYKYVDYVTGEEFETSHTLFTLGNISMIKGASKSQKTYLISMLAGCYLNNENEYHNGLFNVKKQIYDNGTLINKKIIYFDTEQHRSRTKKIRQRINRIASPNNVYSDNKNLNTYTLREMGTVNRLLVIKKILSIQKNSLVFIDGIIDIMRDFNDNIESTEIVDLLMEISSKNNCHICVVIHNNPGTQKARGHSGTILGNKCEMVLNIEQEGKSDVRIVKCEATRYYGFKSFHFEVNPYNGLPYILNSENINKEDDNIFIKE
jgi:hypothetical protein